VQPYWEITGVQGCVLYRIITTVLTWSCHVYWKLVTVREFKFGCFQENSHLWPVYITSMVSWKQNRKYLHVDACGESYLHEIWGSQDSWCEDYRLLGCDKIYFVSWVLVFLGTFCPHFQIKKRYLLYWRWKQEVSVKCWYQYIKLSSVTAQKSLIFNPPTPDIKRNMERTQGK